MIWFRQAEGDAVFSGNAALNHCLLLGSAVEVKHGRQRQIADDGMLVLQVVVEAETLRCKVFANHRHPQI